jgi:hypothetical protein
VRFFISVEFSITIFTWSIPRRDLISQYPKSAGIP